MDEGAPLAGRVGDEEFNGQWISGVSGCGIDAIIYAHARSAYRASYDFGEILFMIAAIIGIAWIIRGGP